METKVKEVAKQSNILVPHSKLQIGFGKDITTIVEVYNIPDTNIFTISKIVPQGHAILLAEIGLIDVIQLVNFVENKQRFQIESKLMVVGINDSTPKHINIGNMVLPRMSGESIIRPTFDPSNKYAYEFLLKQAKDDPTILAATSIAFDKEKSRLGLNMSSRMADSQFLDKLSHTNPKMKGLIYKGKKLPFLNYKLTDYTNIDAIIYDYQDNSQN